MKKTLLLLGAFFVMLNLSSCYVEGPGHMRHHHDHDEHHEHHDDHHDDHDRH